MTIATRRNFSKSLLGLGLLSLVKPSCANQNQKSAIRIVSLGGAITEIIYELNLQKYLVGIDTTSNYPLEVKKYPSVGYARALSVEGVLSLSPTHILATEDVGPPAFVRAIKSNKKINFQILDSEYGFNGLIKRVREVAGIGNAIASQDKLIQRLNESWRTAYLNQQVIQQPPKVLFLLSHQASRLLVSGRDTGAAAMIHYAGGVNAMTSYVGYKPLNIEAFIEANPDIILMTKQSESILGGLQALLKIPALGSVAAVRNHRFISIDANQLLGFGPRLPETVLELRRALLV
jgi:iron complex transport system substrate-binding protein